MNIKTLIWYISVAITWGIIVTLFLVTIEDFRNIGRKRPIVFMEEFK
jgi:hypothetical protein